jgi:hypothetical protein
MDTPEEPDENVGKAVAGYLKALSGDVVTEIHVHGLSGALALFAAHWWKMDPEQVFVLLAVIALCVAGVFRAFKRWLRRRHAKQAFAQKPAVECEAPEQVAAETKAGVGPTFRGYM